MRCSTCGEKLDGRSDRCPTCGAAVTSVATTVLEAGVKRCPRCGFRGDGISYFRRPGHVALLVGVSLITYGVGGLVYWLLKRGKNICPNCGLNWEYSSGALPAGARGTAVESHDGSDDDSQLPRSGMGRRVLGVAFIIFALFMFGIGFTEWEPALFSVAGASGAAGTLSFWWGLRAQEERRKALMTRMQRRVLRLAGAKGGNLTVTEVAAELDLSMQAAEKILIGMDDGFRVRSEITDQGVIVYEFPEIQHRSRLEPGQG